MFCPNSQKLLKPTYDLSQKGRLFILIKMHQEAFEDIKSRLSKSPVLHLPDNTGRFQLFQVLAKQQ